MPIEAASYPEDLAAWDSETSPFYFEIFGETSPRLASAPAERQFVHLTLSPVA